MASPKERRKAREYALQMLYQWEGERGDPAAVPHGFWRDWQVAPAVRAYADQLFAGAVAAHEEIDQLIAAQAEHWRLERMAAVDRNLLRLAVYEMRSDPKTSAAVFINEALEVARRFSSAESVTFINGVLDAVRKSLEAQR
ncbi:MAG: transcription antitermination factor NusB [Terriglobia bacterium]